MSLRSVHPFLFCVVLAAASAHAAERMPLYVENDIPWGPVRSIASSFEALPLPADGQPQHAFLVSGYRTSANAGTMSMIKAGYDAGQAVVIAALTPDTQSFLDAVTGGDVQLPAGINPNPDAIGEPRLEAIAVRRKGGIPDIGEFWDTFDADDGPPADEKAEDDRMIGRIAEWIRDSQPAVRAMRTPAPMAAKARTDTAGRPAIDDLTNAVVRKVSFAFDQGSMATVVRSWAAHSPSQNEDWYIFELTTTSQPLNFATYSLAGMFAEWEKNDANCRGILKTGCKRVRYATKVQVNVEPKTPGLELVYYGPDSDREQDEYSYTSKFSLGGKITAGFDDKGPKAGVELSGGVEFSRSTKVTIKDATLVGISNPAKEMAGWRFDMPQMRAVNDLTAFGGPSMNCDNLLQMPYPVQRGAMESRQYAIYRLPGGRRVGLDGINIAVSLRLEESSSRLQNWTAKYCNILNCNCSPESWVEKNHELNATVISFPLAAHPQ